MICGQMKVNPKRMCTYLVQLDDVRMPDFLENFDLTRDSLNIFLIMNLLFLQNLNRDLNSNWRDQ